MRKRTRIVLLTPPVIAVAVWLIFLATAGYREHQQLVIQQQSLKKAERHLQTVRKELNDADRIELARRNELMNGIWAAEIAVTRASVKPPPEPAPPVASFWGLFLLLMLPFCLALYLDYRVSRRKLRRLSMRQCIHCGYDVRHTPAKCPECGRHPRDVFALLAAGA